MKNVIVCGSCKNENPFYQFICRNCKAYLRERVVNIDLFSTLWMLIENPKEAFTRIIRSEHKNFIVILLLVIAVKLLILSKYFSLVIHWDETEGNFLLGYFLILSAAAGMIFLFSYILKYLLRSLSETRVLDNFSLLVYSLFPYLLGLIFLFPVEALSFGAYLFLTNPSPFEFKSTLAWILAVFEILLMGWSFFLTLSAIKVQSGGVAVSLIYATCYHLLIFGIMFLLAAILFV